MLPTSGLWSTRSSRNGVVFSETIDSTRYRKQYLKGLATSTNEDAKVYFGDLQHHLASLRYTGDPSDKMIQLAFAKDKANDRKTWLQEP